MRRRIMIVLLACLATGCTAPATIVPPEPVATTAVPVYYVADTAAGPRLQREFRRVPLADAPSEAVRTMLAAPTGLAPGDRNPWPAGTSLLAPVTHADGRITVPVSVSPPSPLAAQQLVFTVQGVLGSTDPVLLNGVRVERGDAYALRNLVQIDEPVPGATAPSPLVVTGEAAVFEATLPWSVTRDGTTVRTGVASTAEGQRFAPFRFTVDLPPGRYVVTIREDDPSGGAGRPVLTHSRAVTIT